LAALRQGKKKNIIVDAETGHEYSQTRASMDEGVMLVRPMEPQHHAPKKPGKSSRQSCLSWALAGGVGAAAIELAKASGVAVSPAVSSEESAVLRDLGADETITLQPPHDDRARKKPSSTRSRSLLGAKASMCL